MKTPLLPETALTAGLTARAKTVCTAESCTGGLIAHRLTNVSGASACFPGGVVAYANEVKVRVLGVRETTLASDGAVSEATARQMVEGARAFFDTDYSVAVTGIAGPTGGSPEKPVGTVYMGFSGAGETRVVLHHFEGDRDSVKAQTADTALRELREFIGI